MFRLRGGGICIGGAAALMIAAAQTGPDDAISNIAGWYQTISSMEAPVWLANARADEWALWAGILLLLLGMILVVLSLHHSGFSKTKRPQLDADRRAMIHIWREAAFQLQASIDALPPGSGYMDAKHIIHRSNEYAECYQHYMAELGRTWEYKKWRVKQRMRRLAGLHVFHHYQYVSTLRLAVADSTLHVDVDYMLRRIAYLENKWKLL